METLNKRLVLITNNFPYTNGENFILGELDYLSKIYKDIIIVPISKKDSCNYKLPENVVVLDYESEHTSIGFYSFLVSINLFFSELFGERFFVKLKSFRKIISILKVNFIRANKFQKLIERHQLSNAIFYSFWFDEGAIICSILSHKSVIKGYISRTHGFDLYKERWVNKYIPFISLKLKYLNHLVFASKFALNYFKYNYKGDVNLSLAYLSTQFKGDNPIKLDELTLVSCFNVIPLKRIDRILKVLNGLKVPCKWIHIGNASNEWLIKEIKTLPSNVQIELKGFLSPLELLAFYQSKPISGFLHFSETEGGVPLALQEAASMGIPLFAYDAGGVGEIVNDSTGQLIKSEVEFDSLISIFNNYKAEKYFTKNFRKQVKDYWIEKFSPEVTYKELHKIHVNV